MRRLALLAALAALAAGCGSSGSSAIDAKNASKLKLETLTSASWPEESTTAPHTYRAPNGRWAVIVEAGKPVRLVDAHTGRPLDALSVVAHPTAVAWTPDSRTFAVGDASGKISVWEEFDHRTFDLQGGHARVFDLAFSPDTLLLASVQSDRTLRVWDLLHERQAASYTLPQHADRVAFTQDGKAIKAGLFELKQS
jgi:WD40 repeat protein